FFFFQAEDGIRDFHVTGVQTCALPIFMPVVVALLFLSGFALFDIRCNGFSCIGPTFGWGWLLLLKATLAFAVLGVFVGAIRAGRSEERRVGKEGRCRVARAAWQSGSRW